MTALALFTVFAVAKLAVLIERELRWSWWMPIAYFWQDALVALLFAAADRVMARHSWTSVWRWPLYWTLVFYAAVNVPVGRVLATPATWPMLRATRGALADSLLLYVTWPHVLLMTTTVAAGAIAFLNSSQLALIARRSMWVAAGAVLLGPAAASHADTRGLERNAIAALVASAWPRVPAVAAQADWRRPLFDGHTPFEELPPLSNTGHGMNIVLVSLESTAAEYLSVYGGHHNVSPNLEALAQTALVFENAYAVYPESIKGLYSMLCATFPAFDRSADAYADLPCDSAADVLGRAGYRTGLFHSGRFDYLGMDAVVRDRGYETLEDAGTIGGERESSFGVDEESTVARMLEWIDDAPDGRPFFLTYLPIAGHHPYEAPDEGPFPGHTEEGRYKNALRYADRMLGALVDGVRRRGLEDRTVWVVAGDHGEAFGQHDGNYGHTFFLYDENVRVPFIVSVPGSLHTQTRTRRVVSLVDTAPTILDLAGIRPPSNYQGRSALKPGVGMALFFTDYSLSLVGLRDGRWKTVCDMGSRRCRLFDVAADPRETTDLSVVLPSQTDRYQQHLRDWSSSQKAYLERLESAAR